jgi:hypothetical protein
MAVPSVNVVELTSLRGRGASRSLDRGIPLPRATGRITQLTFFLDTDALFPLFGLPPHLDG